jgi:hypothetical protein
LQLKTIGTKGVEKIKHSLCAQSLLQIAYNWIESSYRYGGNEMQVTGRGN